MAAEALDVAPSAISRQIMQLERQLGTKLLERSLRGAKPTEAGNYVLEYYRHAVAGESLLYEQLQALQGMRAGSITISTGAGYVKPLSETIARFSAKYPDIHIHISINGSNEIIRKVLDNEVNFGIIYNAINHPKLKTHYRTRHPLAVFLSKNHQLAEREVIDVAELATERLAFVDTTHGIRQSAQEAERDCGILLTPTLLCNDMNLLKEYASAGGVTLLPAFMLLKEDEGRLLTRPLTQSLFATPESQIISRRDAVLSPAAQLLATELVSMLRRL